MPVRKKDPKTEIVKFRSTPAQKRLLERAAAKSGSGLSFWLLALALRAAGHELERKERKEKRRHEKGNTK